MSNNNNNYNLWLFSLVVLFCLQNSIKPTRSDENLSADRLRSPAERWRRQQPINDPATAQANYANFPRRRPNFGTKTGQVPYTPSVKTPTGQTPYYPPRDPQETIDYKGSAAAAAALGSPSSRPQYRLVAQPTMQGYGYGYGYGYGRRNLADYQPMPEESSYPADGRNARSYATPVKY